MERGRPKKDPEKVRTKWIGVRITEDEMKTLEGIATWSKMSRSETMRTLIKEAYNYYICSDQK